MPQAKNLKRMRPREAFCTLHQGNSPKDNLNVELPSNAQALRWAKDDIILMASAKAQAVEGLREAT